MRRLEQRQEALLKQRGGKAELNDLVRELARLDAEEREARALVKQYEGLRGEEREQQTRAAELQEEADALQRRSTELQALVELQPRWQERDAAGRELAELPHSDQAGFADEVAGLLRELQAQQAREERLAELDAAAAAEGATSRAALQHLGAGWDMARVRALDASRGGGRRGAGLGRRHRAGREALRDAQRAAEAGTRQAAQLAAEVESRRAQAPADEPPTVAHIDRDEGVLRGLRDDAARLETLRLKAGQQAPPHRDGARAAWVLAALAALGAAAGLLTGHAQLGAGLAVAAGLLAVMALLTRRGPAAPAHGDEVPVIRELQASIAAAAATLSLPAQPVHLRPGRLRGGPAHGAHGPWRVAGRRSSHRRRTESGGAGRRPGPGGRRGAAAGTGGARAGGGRLGGVARRSRPAASIASRASASCCSRRRWRATPARAPIWPATRPATSARRARSATRRRGACCTRREGMRSSCPGRRCGRRSVSSDADLARGAELRQLIESVERLATARLSSCEHPVVALDELACGDVGIWQDEAQRLDDDLERLHDKRDAAIEAAARRAPSLAV